MAGQDWEADLDDDEDEKIDPDAEPTDPDTKEDFSDFEG